MKFSAFLLSVLILALSLNPCVDRPIDNNFHKNDITNTKNHNHEGENNHCSPFCTCQCCQTTCFVADFIHETPITESPFIYSELILVFKNAMLSEFLIPPKKA